MAGKGDKPRNCFSNKWFQHYDEIDWHRPNNKENKNERKPNRNRKSDKK